jgi:hypothetical protein
MIEVLRTLPVLSEQRAEAMYCEEKLLVELLLR